MTDRKYFVETTVTGAEDMWDFVQGHRVVVRALSKIKAEPTKFKYELRMSQDLAVLFVLMAAPLSCTEIVE